MTETYKKLLLKERNRLANKVQELEAELKKVNLQLEAALIAREIRLKAEDN